MNRRLTTIVLLALLIAAGCTYLSYRIFAGRIVASRPVPTTRVLAAASDLKLGSVITSADLTTVDFAGQPPAGTLQKPEGVIGRGVTSVIYKGEPLMEERLALPGSGGGMAAIIPRGMRAIAVRVDEVVGVAGFVTPGMKVDVLVSGNPGFGKETMVTQTLLQNIEVLSAGTDIQKDAEGKPLQVQVVNLLVTPDQAQRISLAGNNLRIQLVLRNPLDTKVEAMNGTGMSSLFGGVTAPVSRTASPARETEPRSYAVEVINGSKHSEEKFAVAGGKQ